LIIFGNPKLGTPLMQQAQTLAIDLPQKMLVYQTETGEVFRRLQRSALSGKTPQRQRKPRRIRQDCQRLENSGGNGDRQIEKRAPLKF
jgi:Uncharacterized conserved protein